MIRVTTTLQRRRNRHSEDRAVARDGVLQVITSTSRRGAEVFGVDLGDELGARGRTVTTVALVPGQSPSLDVPTLGKRALGLRTLLRLRRRARSSSLVIAHGSSAVVATALATLGTSTPFVYRNIGDPSYWFDTPKRRRRMRWILRRARAVVALWDGSETELRRLGGPSIAIRVIPKGVPARRFPLVDEGSRTRARALFGARGLTVVYIGSLTPEKNVDAAISALGLLPDAQLLVVGAGSDRDRLEALGSRIAPGRIIFSGALSDPAEALAAADVLILPSLTEGIPGVLIEAAFSGLPVVATAVGGVPGVVSDGQTGILVREPTPSALAEAIAAAGRAGRVMGMAGRSWCEERFEIGTIADRWDALLAELGTWSET